LFISCEIESPDSRNGKKSSITKMNLYTADASGIPILKSYSESAVHSL